MKVKNVIVPVLVFLFSVVVFALFYFVCLFVFFHCLYFGDGFHHSWPTMIRTFSVEKSDWNS